VGFVKDDVQNIFKLDCGHDWCFVQEILIHVRNRFLPVAMGSVGGWVEGLRGQWFLVGRSEVMGSESVVEQSGELVGGEPVVSARSSTSGSPSLSESLLRTEGFLPEDRRSGDLDFVGECVGQALWGSEASLVWCLHFLGQLYCRSAWSVGYACRVGESGCKAVIGISLMLSMQ
jgi:hypothetical protein